MTMMVTPNGDDVYDDIDFDITMTMVKLLAAVKYVQIFKFSCPS